MTLHIILMNLVAPLLAIMAIALHAQWRERAPGALLAGSLLQIVLLWAWHAPPVLQFAARSHSMHLLMQGSLLMAAFVFWSAVLAYRGDRRWKPIMALLVTSKLFCLLAALFVFSPRALYPALAAAAHHPGIASAGGLEDQQLAGLVMLIACPLTFVLSGILLAGRWIFDMEQETATLESSLASRRA